MRFLKSRFVSGKLCATLSIQDKSKNRTKVLRLEIVCCMSEDSTRVVSLVLRGT